MIKINLNKKILDFLIPLGILLLSLILHLWQINIIPIGISHVELDYVINAKSVWLTGKDLSQRWPATSLTALNSRETLAELPQVLWAPFIGPLPLSLFNARWPIAIFYSFFPVILYLITKLLLKRNVAIIAGLFFSISPWLMLLGRSNYEHPMSALFYLIGIYLFLKNINWKILLSFPFFFLGFYSYHGAKMVLIPLVLILSTYHYLTNKHNYLIKYYVILTIACIVPMITFILSLPHQAAGSRSNQIIFLNKDYIANKVNQERLLALNNPLTPILSNKFTIITKELISTYFNTFSTQNLFIAGEQTVGGLTLGKHGYFYYLDFPFLFIGLIALFIKHRKVFFLLLGIILIAPINSIISIEGQSYVCRANLIFPIFTIIISYGFYAVLLKLRHLSLIKYLLIILYLILFINLIYLYFFRNPIYNSEGYFFSKRILSEYLKRTTKLQKTIYVFADEHMATYEQYLFYSDLVNKNNTEIIAYATSSDNYYIDGISFESGCPTDKVLADNDAIIIIESLKDCKGKAELKSKQDISKIVNLVDSGSIFYIYNDKLCGSYPLSNYVRVTNLNAFSIENQNDLDFCTQWIVR